MRDLSSGANGVLSYFIRHKTLANLLLVVLIVAGFDGLTPHEGAVFP